MDNTFDRTKHFHRVAGVEYPNKPVQAPTISEITLGLGLIAEEFVELLEDGFGLKADRADLVRATLEAVIEDCSLSDLYTPEDALDALADIDVVVNRFAGVLGLDMNKASVAVYESNMSKFTTDIDLATSSMETYSEAGRAVRLENIDGYYVIKDANTGKILKCNSFRTPDFTEIFD